jgi:hypothetical protein
LFTNSDDAIAVLESMTRLSHAKADKVQTKLSGLADDDLRKLVRCGYVKATYLAGQFPFARRAQPGPRYGTSSARRESSRRPNTLPTTSSARPRPS